MGWYFGGTECWLFCGRHIQWCNDSHLDKAMPYAELIAKAQACAQPYAELIAKAQACAQIWDGSCSALEVLFNCGNVSGTLCTCSGRMGIPLWLHWFHALALLLSLLAMSLITQWFQDLKCGRHKEHLVSDLLPMATTKRRENWQDSHSLAFIQMHCLSFYQPSFFTSYQEF
jgi:hypothetical protein